MANTGLLPFVRGVDFTCNDFSVSVVLTCRYVFLSKTDDIISLTFAFLFRSNYFSFLQDDKFPDAIRYMTGLQWLRLDKTNLTDIPEELGKLMKLVSSSIPVPIVLNKSLLIKSGNYPALCKNKKLVPKDFGMKINILFKANYFK